jgi:hypothetical protein
MGNGEQDRRTIGVMGSKLRRMPGENLRLGGADASFFSLQLTHVTKSFLAVRALRGVSFDLRAGAPSQPSGLRRI